MFKLKVSDIRTFLKLAGILELDSPDGITFDCSEDAYITNGCNQILEAISHGDNTGYLLIRNGDSTWYMISDNSLNLTRLHSSNFSLVHENDYNKIAPQSLINILKHSCPYLFNMDWLARKNELLLSVLNLKDGENDVVESDLESHETFSYKVERLKSIVEDTQKTIHEMNAANVTSGLELSQICFSHGLARFYYLKYTKADVDLPVLLELVDNIYTEAYEALNWSFDDIKPILPYIGFFPRLSRKLLSYGDALPLDMFESLVRAKGYEEGGQNFKQHISNFLPKRCGEWQNALFNNTSLVLFLVQEDYHGTLRQITRQNQPLKDIYINTLITAPYINMMRYLVYFKNDLSDKQKANLKAQLDMLPQYKKNQEGLIYHGLRMMINSPVSLDILSKEQWQQLLATAEQNPILKQLARLILPYLLPLEGGMHLTFNHMPFIVKALIDDEEDALVPHVQRLAWVVVVNIANFILSLKCSTELHNLLSYVKDQPPNPALAQFFIDNYAGSFSIDGNPSYMDVLVFAMACYLNPVKPYSLIFKNISVPQALPFLYPHAWVLNDKKDALISLSDIYDSVHEQLKKAILPDDMTIGYRAQNQDGSDEVRELTPSEREHIFEKLPQINPSAILKLLKQAEGKVPENMAEAIDALCTCLRAGGKKQNEQEFDAGSAAMEAIAYFGMVYDDLSDSEKQSLNAIDNFSNLYGRTIRSDGYMNPKQADMLDAREMSISFCVEELAREWQAFRNIWVTRLKNIKITVQQREFIKSYPFSCVLIQMDKPNFFEYTYNEVTHVKSTVPDYRSIAPDLHQQLCQKWQDPFSKERPYMPILDADVNGSHEQAFKRLARVLLDEIQRMQANGKSRYCNKLTRYKDILTKLNDRFEERENHSITAQSIKRFEALFNEVAKEHTISVARFFFNPASEKTYQAYITSKTQP